MKTTKPLPIMLLLILPLVVHGRAITGSYLAQSLPSGIRSYLDKNYSGWKLVNVADGCGSEFTGAFATGDFDGDRKRDYIVKFTRGRKGYIMAFLERRNDYETHVLHANKSAVDIRNTGISVFKKGEKYPIGDYEDGRYTYLENDAPFDGRCESDSGGVHVYRNGRFREL